jgi:excisionase family DNA binding protein
MRHNQMVQEKAEAETPAPECVKSSNEPECSNPIHIPDNEAEADYNISTIAEQSIFSDYPDLLSLREAAVISGVTPSTVKAWIKSKCLTVVTKRKAYLIPKLALLEYLETVSALSDIRIDEVEPLRN